MEAFKADFEVEVPFKQDAALLKVQAAPLLEEFSIKHSLSQSSVNFMQWVVMTVAHTVVEVNPSLSEALQRREHGHWFDSHEFPNLAVGQVVLFSELNEPFNVEGFYLLIDTFHFLFLLQHAFLRCRPSPWLKLLVQGTYVIGKSAALFRQNLVEFFLPFARDHLSKFNSYILNYSLDLTLTC